MMLKDMHALTTGRRGTTFPKGSRDRPPDERQLNAILSFAWEGLLLRSIFNYLQSGFPSLDVSVRAGRKTLPQHDFNLFLDLP